VNHRKAIANTLMVALLAGTLIGLIVITLTGPEAQAIGPKPYETQGYDATVSSMSGETHIYNFGSGITPTVPYTRFILRTDGCQIYDATAKALGPKASVAWADSAVLMTDETLTVGGWLLNVPADAVDTADSFLKDGWYDVMTYERAGASAASTDTLYVGRICYINSGKIISFDNR